MKRVYFFTKYRMLCLWMVFVLFSTGSWGAESGRRSRVDRRDEPDTRKQQMEQEAQARASDVQKALTDLLQPVQVNHRPSQDLIQESELVIEDARQYFSAFEDKPRAQFMLLQAWTAFCQDNLQLAQGWSMKACRADEASQDAWISQAVFGLLNGRPPAMPRIEEPKPEPNPERAMARRPRLNTAAIEVRPQPYSLKGILDFDLLGLDVRMIREHFEKTEFQAVSGEKITYTPGKDILCMLFWQGEESLSDANGISGDRNPQPSAEFMEMGMGTSCDVQKTTLGAQRNYVRMLKEACSEQPQIKFIQINTNRQNAAAQATQDPQVEDAGLLVVAADPASNAQRFVGWPAEKPFVAIVDKEGQVRYAGTAADFVPAFILTQLTGVEIDLAKQTPTAGANALPGGMAVPMMMEKMIQEFQARPELASKEPDSDPNRAIIDPNVPNPNVVKPSKQDFDSQTQLLIDQDKANRLLNTAELEIGKGLKLRSNPGKGIEACREILVQFPNTQYAQRARELLRKVPERYKKMNNITDEELGY